MRRRLTLLLFILCIAPLLSAHEFWLHPDKFLYQWGEAINVKLMVGENFEGENWTGNQSSIESLQLDLGETTDDLAEQVDTAKGDSLQFAIYEEGTYMVSFHSKNKFIALPSEKFNEYLKEDGLENAIEYRKLHNETDSGSREHYQRSVKTLFQVGAVTSAVYKKTTNLPLDIIPLQNPYEVKKNSTTEITVKVLFRKKPLANQLIKIWNRVADKTTLTNYTTDENGLIRFPMQTLGRWMVSTVKMERTENDPDAEWQSYWGSCTWGYE